MWFVRVPTEAALLLLLAWPDAVIGRGHGSPAAVTREVWLVTNKCGTYAQLHTYE